MISQKTRTNAVIAYFFLGWIFLIAKNNPDFNDPYIREHSKTATKGHMLFLVWYFIYSHFLSRHFMHFIPFLGITIDRIIELAIFATLTGFIILWGYRAGKWKEYSQEESLLSTSENSHIEYKGASEAERMTFLLSFIPFFGRIIATKHLNIITEVGAKTGTIFVFFYFSYFIAYGFDSASMILLFFYILLTAFFGIRFFFSDTCTLPGTLVKFPSLETLWQAVRSIPKYARDIAYVSFGKNESLNFRWTMQNTMEEDRKFQGRLEECFQDDTLPFSRFLVFIPFVNVLFVPKLFKTRNTRYVLAIWQGIVLTLLAAVFASLFDLGSRIQLIIVFFTFLWTSSVLSNPFYRIPVVYELYMLLNTLSFGLLENTKKIRAVQTKEQSVTFKIQ